MKYRQWKKNYKKKYGANPPFELDKRKQRRYERKMARQINITLPTMMETLTKEIVRDGTTGIRVCCSVQFHDR